MKTENHSPRGIVDRNQSGTVEAGQSSCVRKDKEPSDTRKGSIMNGGSDDVCECGHKRSEHYSKKTFQQGNYSCKHRKMIRPTIFEKCNCKQFKPKDDVCEKFRPIEQMYWTKEEILRMIEDAPDIDRVGEYIKEQFKPKEKLT